ncbi:TPA: hypothetical protein IUX45_002840 [Enterococcus faecalis]|jgi:hypothetical protein|uniref:Uncharacterized protein n=2 Tax=Bacilli TaxID=91061 RepID=A0A640MLD4_BACAN|nr:MULTISPECIES: hypothetical protein [Enterococcus]GEU13048.1 hypothetical protein QuyetLC_54750 [Bacillus anthracis]EGO6088442.1 hypothetical protein [Enterococcus faecalis]EGO7767523.1 hypothetical protein [Enterococcus faecalis]EHU9656879.1 hypothetical protein [Enterococcus faecalis]EIQ7141153.1 hypothetical protein [Enterococcus faecalis]
MQKRKTKETTCKVLKNGKLVGYLTANDEQKGKDIELDRKGYTIVAV